MMTPIATGLMWRPMLDGRIGVINWFIQALGFTAPEWTSSGPMAMITILMIDTWQWTPLVILIVYAGLLSVPQHLYEAAEVDGAPRYAMFYHITYPHIKYMIAIAAGPLINLALFLIGLLLDLTGLVPRQIALPLWVSSALLSINLVPVMFGPKGRRLRTDGMLLLQFWRGTDHTAYDLGAKLEGYNFLRELSEGVHSPQGQIASYLTLAQDYQSAGAQAHAHASLQHALALQDEAKPAETLPELTRICQDYLGLSDADPEEVDELSRPGLLLLKADRLIREDKPDDAREILKPLKESPDAEPWIRTQAEALLLTLDPPEVEVLADQTRDLLRRRGDDALTIDNRLKLLSFTCCQLTKQDQAATELGHFLKLLSRGAKQAAQSITETQVQEAYLAMLFPPELADYRPELPEEAKSG